jgi:beta-lactamase regulating signal transducer with metallopeptidase domain
MSAAWVVYVLLIGALLALAGGAIEDALRRVRLPVRWVWAIALPALIGFSFVALLPARAPEVKPLQFKVGGATSTVNVTERGVFPAWGQITEAVARGEARIVSAMHVSALADRVLTGTWLVASLLVMALIVIVNAMMLRRRAHWPRAELHNTTVRLTPDVGPAVVGFAEPEIVVPHWLLERTDDEQRLALAHEREHVSARDHLLLAGGWIVVALMPWHPASWWMLSRLRLAIELDCDARVLTRGVGARSYGQLLIDIADHCSGQRATALALADHTSHLERRLLAMKKPKIRFGRTRATILAATGALALLVACESKMPTSAEIQNADVATLERKVVEGKLIQDSKEGVRTSYLVNGKDVSEAEAKRIKSDDIMTMNYFMAPDGRKMLVTTKVGPPLDGSKEQLNMKIRRDTAGALLAKKADLAFKTRDDKAFDGIVLIDGKRGSMADLAKIGGSGIESIEVYKNDAAMRAYADPAAANGVISVKTKH